jgi:hypothetical protein
VEVICRDLQTTIVYEGKTYTIDIPEFRREYRKHITKDDPDDIGQIDPRSMSVDLAQVLREEIIMSIY